MTDQQTLGALSAAGNPNVLTPNLDRLARQGTRFEHSLCASPVCSPSRSSLLTGCYPTATGVVYNGASIKPEVPTLGEAFQAAGYQTAWAGKWHLPGAFPGARSPGREPAAVSARGFDFLPFRMPDISLAPFGDFTDEPIAEAAAAFIRREHAQPFLLGVSLHNPHDICYWVMDKLPPLHPALAEFDTAAAKLPPLPRNHLPSGDEPEFIGTCRKRRYYGEENTYTAAWDDSHWRRYLYGYYRMTERVDRSLGIVLDALDRQGLAEDTLLVFTSDHGEGMAAHRWVVKLMLWQEVVSVPLIWRWPGRIAAGRVDKNTLASGVDIMPTLCGLADVPLPRAVHGGSLAAALAGKAGPRRESVFAQLAPDTKDQSMQGRAVRTRRYKYVRFSKGVNPEMFFDLERDPGEMRNLVAEASVRTQVRKHRELLRGWFDRTGDTGCKCA